eukprot:scaffold7349_cov284-Alexandrium_tamarense.AAC.4
MKLLMPISRRLLHRESSSVQCEVHRYCHAFSSLIKKLAYYSLAFFLLFHFATPLHTNHNISTQELVKDPVVAQDGHTYERSSLLTWFSMGRTRSPVTNSLLSNTSIEGLVVNLAVGSMARMHREKLGRRLLKICEGVRVRDGRCGEGVRVRIEGLLDAGADVNGRGSGGNTPLHLLIQSGAIELANHLLNHEASVTLTNDAGFDCIASAEHHLQQRSKSNHEHQRWRDFIEDLKQRETLEKARTEARERARTQANEE